MSIARYLSKFAALLGSDGKVPAAGLADGAVTRAKLGFTGAILQIVNPSAPATITVNATTAYGNSVTLTTTTATSRIMCFVSGSVNRPGTAGNNTLGVKITHPGGTVYDGVISAVHDDTNWNDRFCVDLRAHGLPAGTVLTISPRMTNSAAQTDTVNGLSVLAVEVA